jgi:hypothetical protein
MKRKIWTLFLSILLLFNIGCNNRSSSESSDVDEYYSEDDGYDDGTYCADVTYYNPNTGTRNTYTLEVEVESNELIKIYWNSGGWLDEDHFYAQELDENGTCSFTSDKGYEYNVELTGKDCGYTDETSFQNDVEEDEEAVTCPRCGGEKDEYDDYCYSCKSEIEDEEENTCSRCGGYEYGVYGGLCSNCKQDDEEENEEY